MNLGQRVAGTIWIKNWRTERETRDDRLCRPTPYHLAIRPRVADQQHRMIVQEFYLFNRHSVKREKEESSRVPHISERSITLDRITSFPSSGAPPFAVFERWDQARKPRTFARDHAYGPTAGAAQKIPTGWGLWDPTFAQNAKVDWIRAKAPTLT